MVVLNQKQSESYHLFSVAVVATLPLSCTVAEAIGNLLQYYFDTDWHVVGNLGKGIFGGIITTGAIANGG